MQNPQDDIWKRRLVAALAALLVAYSAHALTSMILIFLEESGLLTGGAFMPVLLTIQAVIFGMALIWQLKMPNLARSFESAALVAAAFLLLAIPAVMLVALRPGAGDTSPDQGAGAAGFFMVIIFGGFYGLQGLVLLIAGLVLRRRRKDAEPARPTAL